MSNNPSGPRPDSDVPWNEATKASFDGYVSENPPANLIRDSVNRPAFTPGSAGARMAWRTADSFGENSKRFSEHYDPCQEAANKSIKCIHRNAGNKDLCNDYFQ